MLTAMAEVAPPDALWERIKQSASLAPDESQLAKPASQPRSTVARPSAEPAWLRPAAARRVWPWKVATFASLALAAGSAAIVLMPSLAGRLDEPMPGGRDISLVAMLGQPDSPGGTRPDNAPQMASATGTATLVEPSPDTADPVRAAGHVAGFFAATWPDGTVALTAVAPVQVPAGKTLELWIQPPDAKAPRPLGVLPATGRQVTLSTMPEAGTALSVTLEPAGGAPMEAPTGRVVYAGTLQRIRQ